jgi:hypothetical protein
VYVDSFDKCVIRNTFRDFYIQENRVPTISKLLPIIKQKIHFVVKSLGCKWKKCQSKKNILVETADILDWRSRYLVNMKEYRDKERPIFYTDDS